jgi:hypothetical protein
LSGGAVRGVTTQDKTTLYFLQIFWSREITAQGYCVPQKATAAEGGEIGSTLSKVAASPGIDLNANAEVNADVERPVPEAAVESESDRRTHRGLIDPDAVPEASPASDVQQRIHKVPVDSDANGSSTDSGAEFL